MRLSPRVPAEFCWPQLGQASIDTAYDGAAAVLVTVVHTLFRRDPTKRAPQTGGTIRGSDRDPLLVRPKHVAIRQCVCNNRVVIHPPPLCPSGFEGGLVDGGPRNR